MIQYRQNMEMGCGIYESTKCGNGWIFERG